MEGCGRFIPALFNKDFFSAGFTSVPNLLFKYAPRLPLESTDILVIIALLYFQQTREEKPTLHEFMRVINVSEADVKASLERMRLRGLLNLSGECLDPTGLFEKIMDLWAAEKMQNSQGVGKEINVKREKQGNPIEPLIKAFEQEFGRPLTPIELDQIRYWNETKGYSEKLILEALRRAVLQGVCNFKYIDGILAHWEKNNLRTVREVKQFEEKYLKKYPRKGRMPKANSRWEEKEEKYRDLYVNRLDD